MKFAPVFLISCLVPFVSANTEKTVFLGPPTVNVQTARSILADLHIDTLTPENGDDSSGRKKWSLRTHLKAQFPSSAHPYGKAAWFLLDELAEGQRYEVRVCWAATQPTSFRLSAYELRAVLKTPELISGLSDHSLSQHNSPDKRSSSRTSASFSSTGRETSALLLQVFAAADYYTTNKTLMENVPPVHVDIILDPFILNALPRSLLPTVAYIAVVAAGSWILAQRIATWIRQIATEPSQDKKSQ